MAAYPYCPVSGHSQDDNTARLVALFVVILVAAAAFSPARWLIALVFVDFLWRSLGTSRPSPLAWVSRRLLDRLGAPRSMTDAGPKVFAARVGLGFSVAIAVSFALGYALAGQALALMLAVAAGLHAGAGFCAACEIYKLWFSLRAAGWGTRRAAA